MKRFISAIAAVLVFVSAMLTALPVQAYAGENVITFGGSAAGAYDTGTGDKSSAYSHGAFRH